MLDTIRSLIKNKNVLILGFGKEGQSTFRTLKLAGGYARLDIADRSAENRAMCGEHGFLTGGGYMDTLDTYDIVFKTPGIVLPRRGYTCRVTSQTDIFLREYGKQTIGITGTKGKSTVSSLLSHVLGSCGVDCLLAGNIGIPAFDIAGKLSPETVVLLELSCHQLEYCSHSPSVSLLLNIFEDHLDHYESFGHYTAAKTNIYRHQSAADTLFCNPGNIPLKEDCVSRVVPVSVDILPFESFDSIEGVKLRGAHNLLNCAFVYSVCETFGISGGAFIKALESFRPLPHRLEFIGARDGVEYYDDSISTTVESAISAVKSVDNASVLLLGGMDRGISYSALADFLPESGLTYVILMYESGKRIYDLLKDRKKTPDAPEYIHVPDLYHAAALAREYAKPGTACILSPASASYGGFKNFEERGDVFKKLIFI